jgi:ABC-type siderophore export system fused ATPase/permease subunit
MSVATTGCFHQFIHNMLGRGLIRIAHTEVDNVLPSGASLLFEVTDNIKDVWRQALDTPKLVIHNYLTLLGAPAVAP